MNPLINTRNGLGNRRFYRWTQAQSKIIMRGRFTADNVNLGRQDLHGLRQHQRTGWVGEVHVGQEFVALVEGEAVDARHVRCKQVNCPSVPPRCTASTISSTS